MPASAAAIPPWIAQPADPAAHFAQGYQIGAHVGAQQAAQAFQAQQMALEQHKELMREQQQAYEDQMNTQVLNMKAAETARRFQANQEFRARVGAGEDPASVLMQLAPDLGESPTAILHNQAAREQAHATMQFRRQHEQRVAGDALVRQQQAAAGLAERVKRDTDLENKEQSAKTIADKRERRIALTAIQNNKELKELRDALDLADSELRNHRATPVGWFQTQKSYDANIKALEKNREDAAKAVDSRLKELRQEYGIEDEAPGTTETGSAAPPSPERAGNDTMPDAPAERVRVKSPNGKIGSVPRSQLEEAKKLGYEVIP